MATLLDDGRIELDLRAENDAGISGHALFEVGPGHSSYSDLRERLSRSGRRSRGGPRTIVLDAF